MYFLSIRLCQILYSTQCTYEPWQAYGNVSWTEVLVKMSIFIIQRARKESYEGNQSFPKLPKTHRAEEIDDSPPEKIKLTLDDFKGNWLVFPLRASEAVVK